MVLFACAVGLALPACASDDELVLADSARDVQAAADAKALLVARAGDLRAAAETLCAAAPAPAADGWSLKRDGASLAAMKKAWKDAHGAYASIEGAVALLLPARAAALDGRYDEALAAGPDPDAFNDQGFIGLHAVERVLWADRIPSNVKAFESTLAGYAPAAFPADAAESTRFRTGLCVKLVADATGLGADLDALDLDSSAAYEGAARLVTGQLQKVVDAGNGREESRYAGYSLADLSAAVASAKETHAVFQTWLLTKPNGASIDKDVEDGFARLEKEYAAFGSDALPQVPMGWSNADVTAAARKTPFGQLFSTASFESNSSFNGSLARSMTAVATALGITPSAATSGL